MILTTEAEIEQWMTAPTEEALKLQRPLPDGTLKIVATGEKQDECASGNARLLRCGAVLDYASLARFGAITCDACKF